MQLSIRRPTSARWPAELTAAVINRLQTTCMPAVWALWLLGYAELAASFFPICGSWDHHQILTGLDVKYTGDLVVLHNSVKPNYPTYQSSKQPIHCTYNWPC